jgi:hypothetical protein
MPIMQRAGSKSARSLTYQCPRCSYVQEVPLGRPGDRTYDARIPCPRCTRLDNGSELSYSPE